MKQENRSIALIAALMSCLIVLLSFLWQGNKGFNMWDEGYLWYGVQRVLLGELPIQDFAAYDPGRYFWSAALLHVFGDNGIMSLRVAVAIFQTLGLFLAIYLIAQSTPQNQKLDFIFCVFSAIILISWMYPRHKLFDISCSIFLIGALTYLISNPSLHRYFLAGACVGMIAVFGRNHGLYGAVASLGVIAWLSFSTEQPHHLIKRSAYWVGGIVVGFSPLIFLVIVIPEFRAAFLESVLYLLENKSTNIPVPVPWPWKVNFAVALVGDVVRDVLVGLFFIGTILFASTSLIWVIYQKFKKKTVPPVLIASAFLAFPYTHYAFSRADVGHLALGIFPLLVGCLVILNKSIDEIKWPLLLTFTAASLWIMYPFHPGGYCHKTKQCVSVEISGSQILMDPGFAADVALLRNLVKEYAPNGRSFITTPTWPGAYAVMEQKSPIWDIYALLPRDEEIENREIERIKASSPGFIFIHDFPLDGREDRRYRNLHPIIYQYIVNHYKPVPNSPSPTYQIFIPR